MKLFFQGGEWEKVLSASLFNSTWNPIAFTPGYVQVYDISPATWKNCDWF